MASSHGFSSSFLVFTPFIYLSGVSSTTPIFKARPEPLLGGETNGGLHHGWGSGSHCLVFSPVLQLNCLWPFFEHFLFVVIQCIFSITVWVLVNRCILGFLRYWVRSFLSLCMGYLLIAGCVFPSPDVSSENGWVDIFAIIAMFFVVILFIFRLK